MTSILKLIALLVAGALALFFGFWVALVALAFVVLFVGYGLATHLCGVPFRITRTMPNGEKHVVAVYRFFKRVA